MRIPPHIPKKDLDRYLKQTALVRNAIENEREELTDEFGNFQLMDLPTGRVLLMPEGAPEPNEWFCCYLHDASADARLLVDDYVPELEDSSDPEEVPLSEQATYDSEAAH